jgi:hypothetical protein
MTATTYDQFDAKSEIEHVKREAKEILFEVLSRQEIDGPSCELLLRAILMLRIDLLMWAKEEC